MTICLIGFVCAFLLHISWGGGLNWHMALLIVDSRLLRLLTPLFSYSTGHACNELLVTHRMRVQWENTREWVMFQFNEQQKTNKAFLWTKKEKSGDNKWKRRFSLSFLNLIFLITFTLILSRSEGKNNSLL